MYILLKGEDGCYPDVLYIGGSFDIAKKKMEAAFLAECKNENFDDSEINDILAGDDRAGGSYWVKNKDTNNTLRPERIVGAALLYSDQVPEFCILEVEPNVD